VREGGLTINFIYVAPSQQDAMSIDKGRDKYERRATEQAWQNGLQEADSPGEGLEEAGVSNLNTTAFDNDWEDGIEEGDDYEPDGDEWFSQMSDASNWNYSGNQ
jgi:hypothetical protein